MNLSGRDKEQGFLFCCCCEHFYCTRVMIYEPIFCKGSNKIKIKRLYFFMFALLQDIMKRAVDALFEHERDPAISCEVMEYNKSCYNKDGEIVSPDKRYQRLVYAWTFLGYTTLDDESVVLRASQVFSNHTRFFKRYDIPFDVVLINDHEIGTDTPPHDVETIKGKRLWSGFFARFLLEQWMLIRVYSSQAEFMNTFPIGERCSEAFVMLRKICDHLFRIRRYIACKYSSS